MRMFSFTVFVFGIIPYISFVDSYSRDLITVNYQSGFWSFDDLYRIFPYEVNFRHNSRNYVLKIHEALEDYRFRHGSEFYYEITHRTSNILSHNDRFRECVSGAQTDLWLPYNCHVPYFCGDVVKHVETNWWGRSWYSCFGNAVCNDTSSFVKYCSHSRTFGIFAPRVNRFMLPTPLHTYRREAQRHILIDPYEIPFYLIEIVIAYIPFPFTVSNAQRYFYSFICDDLLHLHQPQIFDNKRVCFQTVNIEVQQKYCSFLPYPAVNPERLHALRIEHPEYVNLTYSPKPCRRSTDYIPFDNQYDLVKTDDYYCFISVSRDNSDYLSNVCVDIPYSIKSSFEIIFSIFFRLLVDLYLQVMYIVKNTILSIYDSVLLQNLLSVKNRAEYLFFRTFVFETFVYVAITVIYFRNIPSSVGFLLLSGLAYWLLTQFFIYVLDRMGLYSPD